MSAPRLPLPVRALFHAVAAVVFAAIGVQTAQAQEPNDAKLISLVSGSDEVSAERVRELLQQGADPDAIDADGAPALILAAENFHADAVSVLLVADANPTIRTNKDNSDFTILHHVAYHGDDPRALEVLRHFIGGLRAAGKADSFDGWNALGTMSGDADKPPMFFLSKRHDEPDSITVDPVALEIHSLLREWGARCETEAGPQSFCGAQYHSFRFVVNDYEHVGPAFTITLRPPARTTLTLHGRSLGYKLPGLTRSGWDVSINTATHPHEWIFSRARSSRAGDMPESSIPELPLLDGDGKTVRFYWVDAQMIVNDPHPLHYSAEGGGSLRAFAGGREIPSGITLRPGPDNDLFSAPELTLSVRFNNNNFSLTFRAVADIGHHISGWTENCAASPSGVTVAESECALTLDGEDDYSLVRVTFRAPRINAGLPLTGDIPGDKQHCELAGGKIVHRPLYAPHSHPNVVWPENKTTAEVCHFGPGLLCIPSDGESSPPGDDNPPLGIDVDCANVFSHVRDCNVENRPAASFSECGAACPSATWAQGGVCEREADQCASASAPNCGILRQCVDPDHERTDADEELCVCRPVSYMPGDPRGGNCGVDGGVDIYRERLTRAATTYIGQCEQDSTSRCRHGATGTWRALSDGAPPNTEDQAGPVLAQAALGGQAWAVSILITTGADPNGLLRRIDLHPGYGPSHIHPLWENGAGDSPRNLQGVLHLFSEHLDRGSARVALADEILRHFIGGMEVAGVLDEFNGWNNLATVRTESDQAMSPRMAFSRRAHRGGSSDPLLNDIMDMLISYGAKCLPEDDYRANPTALAFAYCQRDIPELRAVEALRDAVRNNDAAGVRAAYGGVPSQADLIDESRVPLLIVAATLGYGEIVSVLVALGADANTRHENRAVPHAAALNAGDLPAATVFSVLRHFADAAALVGANYQWNTEGGAEGLRAIDHIALRRNETADDGERAAFMRSADLLLAQGERCSRSPADADPPGVKYNPVCFGSPGLLLATLAAAADSRPTGAEIRSAIQAVRLSGMDPLAIGHEVYGRLLPLAAMRGNAEAVSVLIALGHPPDLRARTDISLSPSALHHIANESTARPDEMAAVFRAFIDGLRVAGALYTFDNWNQLTDDFLSPKVEGGATAMDILLRRGGVDGEMWEWFYEAGAACRPDAGTDAALCEKIPTETIMRTAPEKGGTALILMGTDFRGEPYNIPDDNLNPLLDLANELMLLDPWRTMLEKAPGRFEVQWTRGRRSSDAGESAIFTVTAQLAMEKRTARIWAVEVQAPPVIEQLARFDHRPADGGMLSAEGFENGATLSIGALATFTARPAEGWRVERWEGTGGVEFCSSGATDDVVCILTVPTDSDLLVTAHFSQARAVFFPSPISARRIGADGGGAAQSGELFDPGVTLVFSGNPPRDGRVFRWRRNGQPFPSCDNANKCAMTVAVDGLQAAADYGASVRFSHSPANGSGGALSADGVLNGSALPLGSTVTFTALPVEGWHAAEWNDDAPHGCAPSVRPGPVVCAATLNAGVFASVAFAESRTVSFLPPVVVRRSDADGGGIVENGWVFADGVTLVFSAERENSRVSGWRLNGEPAAACADANPCALAADGGNLRMVAEFALLPRTVHYGEAPDDGSGGRVTVVGLKSGGTAPHGSPVTFIASPEDGWFVSDWLGDNNECLGRASLGAPTEVGDARNKFCVQSSRPGLGVAAMFVQIDAAVICGDNGLPFGCVPPDQCVGGINPCDANALCEDNDNTNRNPAWEICACDGSRGYKGDGRTCELSRVSVRFDRVPADGSGGILTATGLIDENANAGSTVTFTATPAAGYYVSGWNDSKCESGDLQAPGTEKECALTADADLFVTVTFAAARRVEYGDGVLASLGGGSVASGAYVSDGARVTFTALSRANHNLTGWTNKGLALSSCGADLICEVSADDDLDVSALFSLVGRTVFYSHLPSNGNGGTLTLSGGVGEVGEVGVVSGGEVEHGATVTFTATPAGGYYIHSWLGDGSGCGVGAGVGAGVECVLTVTLGIAVTVQFGRDCERLNRLEGSNPGECGDCMAFDSEGARTGFEALERDGLCLHWEEYGEALQADVCLALRRADDKKLEGEGKNVCSGINAVDTFCIMGSTGAFLCRGLFEHVLRCNLEHNRRAENMFFCGSKCADNESAVGAECRQ